MVLGLGSWEIVLLGLALLVFFGPEHAPGAIRKLGELQGRLQAMMRELESSVEEESGNEPEYPRLNMGKTRSENGTDSEDGEA
jgi:Sec-independent protein translocase protein TatA